MFTRKPFGLTPADEQLFAFITPFFQGLPRYPNELHDRLPVRVRIAGPPVVLRDYLPRILGPLAQAFPNLRPHLKAGLQGQIEKWLEEGEADLAITVLEDEPPRGCLSRQLLTLPLVLLVPASAKVTDFKQLCGHPHDTLISPPEGDAITRSFERGLEQQAMKWESPTRKVCMPKRRPEGLPSLSPAQRAGSSATQKRAACKAALTDGTIGEPCEHGGPH